MPASTYKDLLFTKHAQQRLQDRSLSTDAIFETIHAPENRLPQGKEQVIKYTKHRAGRFIQVIAKYLPLEKKYLIISVWVRGEEDRQPFFWQLLSAPFRFCWWIIKQLFRLLYHSIFSPAKK